jgi:hypothetical protein
VSTTPYTPQLRPLSVGEVLDASFKVVRQEFGTLAMCVLVPAVPLNIINTLITASTTEDAFDLETTTSSDPGTGTQIAGSLLTTCLSLVLTTLAAAACFRAVSSIYLGERATVDESLRFAATRLLPLILLSILYFLGLIPAFILLIIPGIWLAVAWSLSFPALMSEGLGPVEALKRSYRLVKGRWWPTFGALLVMYLIVVVISGIVGVLFGATLIAAVDNELVAGTFFTIANILSSLITLPLFAAVLTIIYFDLRVRREGFDLQLLARGVGQAPAQPTAGTSPEEVAAASGLGGGTSPPPSGGFAPPDTAPPGGGFAPPDAPPPSGGGPPPPGGPPPDQPPQSPPPSGGPPPDQPPQSPPPSGGPPPPGGLPPDEPPQSGGLQSGDPLGDTDEPPPDRSAPPGGGGAAS